MQNPIPDTSPSTSGLAVPVGSPLSPTARAIWESNLQKLVKQEFHESRLRSTLQALHAYRTGDLTQGERNALLGRAKEHAQAGGDAMAWVRVQDLLIGDVLSAAEKAGWLA